LAPSKYLPYSSLPVKNLVYNKLPLFDFPHSSKFLVFDIECLIVDGIHTPVAICCVFPHFTRYGNFLVFCVSSYRNSPSSLLNDFLLFLSDPRFDGFHIYSHNFSQYDSIFLIKSLNSKGSLKPLIRDGKLISLTFQSQYSPCVTLHFKDSFLLLPQSLSSLISSYLPSLSKEPFPYKFLDSFDKLSYVGPKPPKSFFPNISDSVYSSLPSPYNLQSELIYYIKSDCYYLHKILIIFFSNLHSKYHINPLNYTTISSIALAIFRTNFLNSSQIPVIHGGAYDSIKESYFGGVVEV